MREQRTDRLLALRVEVMWCTTPFRGEVMWWTAARRGKVTRRITRRVTAPMEEEAWRATAPRGKMACAVADEDGKGLIG